MAPRRPGSGRAQDHVREGFGVPRRLMLLVSLLVVAAFFALTVVGVSRTASPVEPGKPAPEFALPDLDGRVVRLGDYRGKVVLVNFWATWCPPCKEEMPALPQLREEMGDWVQILALDRAEPTDTVRRFVQTYGITFTVLLDPACPPPPPTTRRWTNCWPGRTN